jgi:O-methyltransferase involved in polyketide biosynthesis
MENPKTINLGSVQETLLLPLWGRAVETQKKNPRLIDQKAVSIINDLSYDFVSMAKDIPKITQLSWVARCLFFDNRTKAFLQNQPDGTVVNIGCGFDTTFDRIDNSRVHWFDLDLPDVIDLRKKYIPESDRRKTIAKSVLDKSWYSDLGNVDNVMLMIAGVLYYFDEPTVRQLFDDFYTLLPSPEIVFDYGSRKGLQIANRRVMQKSGMHESARLIWSIDNLYEIEKWSNYIHVIKAQTMFSEFKHQFSWLKKMGMTFFDKANIMSLAHIKIE